MEYDILSPIEIDGIGEILNISLGSSATALSNMLGNRVYISTPRVTVLPAKELSLENYEPDIGVETQYTSGLEGSSILFLRQNDAKAIVDILLGNATKNEEFEFNELAISTVCEVMNQMMGAAATAISEFLGKPVNISPPQYFEFDDFEQFKAKRFSSENAVVVSFSLTIDNVLNSEFVSVISVELARELITSLKVKQESISTESDQRDDAEEKHIDLTQEKKLVDDAENEQPLNQAATSAPHLNKSTAASPTSAAVHGNSETQTLKQNFMPPYGYAPQGGYPPPMYPQGYQGYYYPPEPPQSNPKMIVPQQPAMPHLDATEHLGEEQAQNLELIMSIPLEVSVEIGRTRKTVQDILSFSKGSLLVLDKLAGDQVELFVNGKCIARGDVVVIDDNFGIRVTEIIKPITAENLLKL